MRGCFRFLYHIIKLRQVLNNFPSKGAGVEGAFTRSLHAAGELGMGRVRNVDGMEREAAERRKTEPFRPLSLQAHPECSHTHPSVLGQGKELGRAMVQRWCPYKRYAR